MSAATESGFLPSSDPAACLSAPIGPGPGARTSVNVLLVDDDRALREACASFLQIEGYCVSATGSGDEAFELVKRRRFDLILLDLYMSQVPGMEILRAALDLNKDTLVVVITGHPTVESSLQALRAGAWDYLPKPFTPAHLDVMVGRATHAIFTAREMHDRIARAVQDSGNSELVTCIGVSPKFRQAVALTRRVASTDASMMLCGETGTGKEVLAQVIHQHSNRASKKLVPINCAALPENLLESEMFGHRKGAFTGADRDKRGLLEVADGGTLFLDELTEMSLRLQAKLLRVLQDGVVRRVGSENENATVDVRFISATNGDPQEAVARGVLRRDLFYRLRVVLIKLPPLRQRLEDIPLLANHFLGHYWMRYRPARETLPKFTTASLDVLRSRPWHGNVRELQNVIEHVAVLAEPGQPIRPDDIPFYDEPLDAATDVPIPSALMDEGYYTARDRLVASFEKAYLSRLVGRTGGNMSKAARVASLDRTTLYRLLDRHNVHRQELVEKGGAD